MDVADTLAAVGILAMCAGSWIVHPSAGLLLRGAFLLLIGVRTGKGERREDKER